MTTIVYTEEVMSADSPSSANVTTYLAVEIGMGDSQSSATTRTGNTAATGGDGGNRRAGSPAAKKKGRVSVKTKSGGKLHGYPAGFNPRAFTITAYLPSDGGRRLKVCVCKLTSLFHYWKVESPGT